MIPVIEEQLREKDKEIERLNNIINELEKCFEKTWQNYKDSDSENLYAIAIENKNYLDKLQELKGSVNNESLEI